MIYHLAKELGMTVNKLLSQLTYNELIEWMIYFRQIQSGGKEEAQPDWTDPEEVAKAFNL